MDYQQMSHAFAVVGSRATSPTLTCRESMPFWANMLSRPTRFRTLHLATEHRESMAPTALVELVAKAEHLILDRFGTHDAARSTRLPPHV
jgi:hypothetical protein